MSEFVSLCLCVCVYVYATVFPKWRLLFFAMGTAVKQEVMWPLFNGVVSRWNFGQSKKAIQDLQHSYTFVNFSDPPTQRSEHSLSDRQCSLKVLVNKQRCSVRDTVRPQKHLNGSIMILFLNMTLICSRQAYSSDLAQKPHRKAEANQKKVSLMGLLHYKQAFKKIA